ncbi:hypothetical protein Q9Q99_00065 [Curtobacterium flaccumfaciens]|nr:hypothetical protein Q9Q99_00065 [Curtobacterium flaccumfaciens]
MTAAALAGTIILALSGCGMAGPGKTMTIDEARSQAVTELRSVLELAPRHMATGSPEAGRERL